MAGLDLVAGLSAGPGPCPASSCPASPPSSPQSWLRSGQGRLGELPGPGPGCQGASLPGRRHLQDRPVLLPTDRHVGRQSGRAVPADDPAPRADQAGRLVTAQRLVTLTLGLPTTTSTTSIILQPRPLPGSTRISHLGDILHQTSHLELLRHAQKPGEVILGDPNLPVVHEVNETGELLVLNILRHHNHRVGAAPGGRLQHGLEVGRAGREDDLELQLDINLSSSQLSAFTL